MVLAALGLLVIGLAACGGSSSSSSSGGSSTSSGTSGETEGQEEGGGAAAALKPYLTPPTELVVSEPLSKAPPAGKKAVFLSNGIEIAQEISAGLEAASKALGWQYKTLTVDQNNPATVNSSMLAAINEGADVIFVSATEVEVFKQALNEAKKHGTKVIDIASGNPPTPGITALVNNASQNGPFWGKVLALGAIAEAEEEGTTADAVLVTSPVFATILGPTDKAAEATFKSECPECGYDTLSIEAAQLFSGQAPGAIVSYLQSHPEVNYILQDSSLTDQGLTAALKGAGLGSVKILGVAPLKPQIEAVEKGEEAGWVVDPLQVEGWMGVDAAARSFTGDDPTVYDEVAIPGYLLTKANSPGPIQVPEDYESQFKAMWKGGS